MCYNRVEGEQFAKHNEFCDVNKFISQNCMFCVVISLKK